MAAPVAKRQRQEVSGTVRHDDPFGPLAADGTLSVYGTATSRVVKVLWAVAECGISDVRRCNLPPSDLKSEPWYLALNPKGTVPTFRDGPLVLSESNTIVAYLCQRYGKEAALYPDASPASLALAWQWLEFAESTIAGAQAPVFFAVVRNKPFPAGSAPKTAEEVSALATVLAKAMHVLEDHLEGEGRMYVLGESFTMADITAAVQAYRLFANTGYGFPELHPDRFPAIGAWLKRLETRTAFQAHVQGGMYTK